MDCLHLMADTDRHIISQGPNMESMKVCGRCNEQRQRFEPSIALKTFVVLILFCSPLNYLTQVANCSCDVFLKLLKKKTPKQNSYPHREPKSSLVRFVPWDCILEKLFMVVSEERRIILRSGLNCDMNHTFVKWNIRLCKYIIINTTQ